MAARARPTQAQRMIKPATRYCSSERPGGPSTVANRECLPKVVIQLLKRLCFAGETSMSAACNMPKQRTTRETISIAESLIANSLRTPRISIIDGGTCCANTGAGGPGFSALDHSRRALNDTRMIPPQLLVPFISADPYNTVPHLRCSMSSFIEIPALPGWAFLMRLRRLMPPQNSRAKAWATRPPDDVIQSSRCVARRSPCL